MGKLQCNSCAKAEKLVEAGWRRVEICRGAMDKALSSISALKFVAAAAASPRL